MNAFYFVEELGENSRQPYVWGLLIYCADLFYSSNSNISIYGYILLHIDIFS